MKTKLPLPVAQRVAQAIVEAMAPGTERIEIAGSVRRKKPECGDLEVVAIPVFQGDLFGGRLTSVLDPILEDLCRQRRLEKVKGGDFYKQYLVVRAQCHLDLFLVTKETWGVQFLLRTGPADFSKRVVTQRYKGGLLPDELRVKDGRVWSDSGVLDTPEESDVFAVLGMEWVEPEDRK